MGKANRKMKKKLQQKESSELDKELSRCMEEEEYEEVINVLAQILKTRKLNANDMYCASYAYFMCGDYERSASWISNTLQFDPANVPARILLARLCILQNRTDEGLAVFDLLLGKFFSDLSDDQKDEIEELVEFYGRNDSEKIITDYPNIAKFLNITGPDAKASAASDEAKAERAEEKTSAPLRVNAAKDSEQGRKSPIEILRSLKEKISAAKERAEDAVEDVTARVREKIESKEPEGDMPEQAKLPLDAGGKIQPATDKEASENKSANDSDAEARMNEILSKKCSVMEKVTLLNKFAGAYYYSGNIPEAKMLLKAALELDDGNDDVLRNMAIIFAESGDLEKAVKIASQMSAADFVLLRMIRER